MDYGTKVLSEILEKFENMSDEEYLKLYEECDMTILKDRYDTGVKTSLFYFSGNEGEWFKANKGMFKVESKMYAHYVANYDDISVHFIIKKEHIKDIDELDLINSRRIFDLSEQVYVSDPITEFRTKNTVFIVDIIHGLGAIYHNTKQLMENKKMKFVTVDRMIDYLTDLKTSGKVTGKERVVCANVITEDVSGAEQPQEMYFDKCTDQVYISKEEYEKEVDEALENFPFDEMCSKVVVIPFGY